MPLINLSFVGYVVVVVVVVVVAAAVVIVVVVIVVKWGDVEDLSPASSRRQT